MFFGDRKGSIFQPVDTDDELGLDGGGVLEDGAWDSIFVWAAAVAAIISATTVATISESSSSSTDDISLPQAERMRVIKVSKRSIFFIAFSFFIKVIFSNADWFILK